MAGLAEMLLGKENPFAQWTNDNQGYLGAIGAGIGSGQNIQSGLSNGLQMVPQAKQMDLEQRRQREADAKVLAQTNATTAWLQQNHPDLAQMVEAGMPISEAWNEATRRMSPQAEDQSAFDERFAAGQQYGLEGDDLNTFALTGSVPGTARSNVTYGTTPVWGKDPATGEMGYGVTGSDGTFKRVDTGGMEVLNPYDLNATKAAGTAFGTQTGGTQFTLPMAEQELNQSLSAIEKLKTPDIVAGKDEWFNQAGALPRGMWVQGGSNMANFQVAANNVIDRSWLSARAMLKGGGPITDYESNKAENAVSMMKGALEKGDKDTYDKAVVDYEYWIKQGFAKLKAQAGVMPGYGAGGQPPTAAGAPAGNQTSTGVTWSVEP